MKLTRLQDRLIEIAFDRLLVGALIGITIFGANLFFERYKHQEAQRFADSEYRVKACGEVWAKIYDYEAGLNQLDSLEQRRWLSERLRLSVDEREDLVADQLTRNALQLESVFSAIRERKFYLGEGVASHFYLYVGYLKMRKDAQAAARENNSPFMKQNSDDMINLVNSQLAGMRFPPSAVRTFALQGSL
jgi:hypothetical protein